MNKNIMSRIKFALFSMLLLVGCAGTMRECSSCTAQSLGADWVIVQVDMTGKAFRCWKLEGASVANEERSDGIWWQSPEGHLVHISGLYNRVQVSGGDWDSAYRELGLSEQTCRAISQRVQALNE